MELKQSFVDKNHEDLENKHVRQESLNNTINQLSSFDEIDSSLCVDQSKQHTVESKERNEIKSAFLAIA